MGIPQVVTGIVYRLEMSLLCPQEWKYIPYGLQASGVTAALHFFECEHVNGNVTKVGSYISKKPCKNDFRTRMRM